MLAWNEIQAKKREQEDKKKRIVLLENELWLANRKNNKKQAEEIQGMISILKEQLNAV